MKNIEITPQLLIRDEFREIIFEGRFYYKKGHVVLTHDGFEWRPCNIDFGRPYATNVYLKTMDELYQFIKEGIDY